MANLNANLNLDKAFDKARLENVRNFIRTRDLHALEIPSLPTLGEGAFNKPLPSPLSAVDRKKVAVLTDTDIEEPLGPLLEYLEQSLEVFRKYLSEPGTLPLIRYVKRMLILPTDVAWKVVMTKIWKEVLTVVEGLLVPALSDQPTDMKPLSDKEVDIVFKWLKVRCSKTFD